MVRIAFLSEPQKVGVSGRGGCELAPPPRGAAGGPLGTAAWKLPSTGRGVQRLDGPPTRRLPGGSGPQTTPGTACPRGLPNATAPPTQSHLLNALISAGLTINVEESSSDLSYFLLNLLG